MGRSQDNPLRPATAGEVDAFIALLEEAARWLRDRGIAQWQPGSLRSERPRFVAAQADGELFVVEQSGRLAGGVVVRARPDPVWSDQAEPSALYLSKLVVARDRMAEGLGERMLADVEDIARARGAGWLRLDCVASNEPLARYYQRLGYYPRGTVTANDLALLRHDKRLTAQAGVAVGSFDAVDYSKWLPDRYATLLFVVHDGRVLLIRKKRGHGAGKINGPGGMVESGETPMQCALREIEEEVGLRALGTIPLVELRFQDTDGGRMLGYAFRANEYLGEARESDEAAPFWCPTDVIPYEAMWEDDRLWLPYLLDGVPVIGEFLMHADRLIGHRLRLADGTALLRGTTEPIR